MQRKRAQEIIQRIFFLLVCAAFSGSFLLAGEFWEEKDFRTWSEKECRKLLEDSPWAKKYTWGQAYVDPMGLPPTSRRRETNPRIEYLMQFRSALPLRQALVRLAQIQQHYEELPVEKQKAFDQQAEGFLGKTFPDVVVVHVSYGSNVPEYDRELARFWQGFPSGVVPRDVYLYGSKEFKVPLLEYIAGEGGRRELQFVFPRHHQGRPAVSARDKAIRVEFMSPEFLEESSALQPGTRTEYARGRRIFLEFKVGKMISSGAVAY